MQSAVLLPGRVAGPCAACGRRAARP